MAAPTITLINHTELTDADTATNWVDTVTEELDIKVEGTASRAGVLRADGERSTYAPGTAPITAAGKTLRGWFNTTNIPYLEVKANNGLEIYVSDGTNVETKAVHGSDTYSGGWFNYIWDMDDFTTLTLANVEEWGIRQQLTANAKNVTNAWHDVIRYLDGYSMTGGTSGDKVRLSDIALYDKGTTTLRAYGILTELNGVFFATGTIQFGTGATTHYFEMDGQILVFTDENVGAGLYSLSGVGSGTNIVIKNSVLRSAGTTDNTRFELDFSDTSLASCSITDNLIVRAAATTLQSGMTATGNTFDNCGQITHAGALMNNTVVKNYEGTAGTAAIVYNVNADPSGEIDGLTATKGTAATHVIELGTNTPSSITLSGWTVSGYNASNGQNDSVIYNNSGKAITVNITGGSGTFSYRNGTGASTSVVADQRTLTINARDSAGNLITASTDFTLVRQSDGVVLQFTEDQTDGSVSYTYTYTADVTCYVNVVSSGAYIPVTQENVILVNSDSTVNIVLPADRVYSNP